MKKRLIYVIPFVLTLVFLGCLSISSHLNDEEPVDDEVTRLIESAPPGEIYPDANIIYILDEGIIEVFEDGRCKETVHIVFKVLNDRGKDYADIELGYNSRTQTASIVYARTVTPEGKIMPLNENAIQVVTPYSDYPSYSDYKELTFSMPGVTVGSVIDYKVVREEKVPTIEGNFSDSFYFQAYNPTYVVRYKVITPKDTDLKSLVLNPLQGIEVSPKMIQDGEKKIYLWEYKFIPQIISEKSMPPLEEAAFRILVTTVNSWEEFSHWWREKIEGKTKPAVNILDRTDTIGTRGGFSGKRSDLSSGYDWWRCTDLAGL
jgi:hypothetical protein